MIALPPGTTSGGLTGLNPVDPEVLPPTPPQGKPLPGRELLIFTDAATADARDDYDRAKAAAPAVAAFTNQLSNHVCALYERAIQAREESGVDQMLLMALRQRKGEYEPEKLAQIREMGGSEIYMLITEVKCLAAEAWIYEVLMPSDEKPWSLQPTPIPDIPEEEINAIIKQTIEAAIQDAEAGQPPDMAMIYEYAKNMRDMKLAELRKVAKERAQRMEDEMHDQLTEGGFAEAFDLFVTDLVTYGTGILKGPVLRRQPKRTWGPGGELMVRESIDYHIDHVSPLDYYPSPDATETDEGYQCERMRWTVRQVRSMEGTPGVDQKAIAYVCRMYGEGGYNRERYLDSERKRLENKSQTTNDTRLEGFEYHGPIMGSLLKMWADDATLKKIGFEGQIDLAREYEVCVTVVANVAVRLKANLSPLSDRPYSKSNFKRQVGSFWGRGIPESMRDIQDVCNAAARSLVNNMAIASGPQVAVNDVMRLADGETVERMYPWKLWQFKNPQGHTSAPISFFQPNSNANELMGIFDRFMAMADERTMIPAYAYGNDRAAGAGRTASGLSMLMSSASRSIKKVIGGIDLHTIRPLITRLYDLNMMFHEDASLKGDAQIVARGAIALMLREANQQALAQFITATGTNPTDAQIIGLERRANALRELAKPISSIPVDDLVPSKQEMKDTLKAMADMHMAQQAQQQNQLSPGQPPGAQPQEVAV